MDYTLITGATGHLGKAFAEECLARGENLYLTGRSTEKLTALVAELSLLRPGAKIRTFACDLTDSRSRSLLFEDAQGLAFSRLINVAGVDTQKAFDLYDEDKLTFQMRVNLEGAVSMCNFCIKHRAEKLRIINISSICGQYVMPYFAIYGAAKGALTSFSLAISEEYRKSGVTVTAVLPGAIHTRPDVEEYIESQGFWGKIAAKSPMYVVKKSLSASDRGRRKVIPGVANKLVYISSKFVPQAVLVKLNAKSRRNTYKDAF